MVLNRNHGEFVLLLEPIDGIEHRGLTAWTALMYSLDC